MKIFAEFFLYHFLWYYLFGYFMSLVVMTLKRGKVLFCNMGFISLKQSTLLTQTLIWVNSMLVNYSIIFFKNPITNFSSLSLLVMTIVTRSSSIAAKYATFPKRQLQKYKEVYLTIEEMKADYLLGNWASQVPETMEVEAYNALMRNNFDRGILYITFLDTINEKILKSISEIEKQLKLPPSSISVDFYHGGRRSYFSGLTIFYVMTSRFNKTYANPWIDRFILFQSVVTGLMPLFAKLMLGLPIFSKSNLLDTATFYFNIVSSTQLLCFTNYFFSQAQKDINRTVYIMHQLSHLISTQRKSDEIIKILPTLNFLEESSINSWKMLRRMSMDYGKKFFHRHEIHLPVMFCLAFVCFFGLFLLQGVHNRFPLALMNNVQLLELQLVLLFLSFNLFYMTLHMLLGFARINEFYEVHILRLATVRQVLCDLLKYDLYYFGKYFVDLKTVQSSKSGVLLEVFRVPSDSHVHIYLAREIASILGPQIDTKLCTYLEKSISTIDRITADLNTDQRYQSIEIIGFVITKPFIAQLVVIIVSITVGFYQLFIV